MGLLSSLLPAIAPLANQFLNKGSTNAANAASQAGLQAYQNLTLPQLQQLLYTANQSTAANPYNASLAIGATQGPNAYNNINLNPQAQQAELSSLAQLQGIANNGGLSPAMQQQLMEARNQENANEQGQRGAIMQAAQSRGLGDSQLNIAAQLAAQQQGANTAAQQGYQAAGQAQQNMLNAIQGAANIGSNVYGQQYNQAANQAAAQNTINNFNAQAQQAAGLQNANAQNTAASQGVANQQQTNLANQTATNTAFQNNAANTLSLGNQQLTQAGGIAGAGQNVANQQNLQNKLNTATDTPMLNTLFGNNGGTTKTDALGNTTTTTPQQNGVLSTVGTNLSNYFSNF